jgi:hypothetical protein
MAEEVKITARKVYAANGFSAKLLGLTMAEIGVLLVVFVVCYALSLSFSLILAVETGVGLFLKRLARKFPERYMNSAFRYWFRSTFHYRASAEDTTARPYLLPPGR